MKKAAVAAVAVVAVAGASIVSYGLWLSGDVSECYASFRSNASAEAAAADVRAEGHDARVEDQGRSATFSSDETGPDAGSFRTAFRTALKRRGGKPAHPGGGCTERGRLD